MIRFTAVATAALIIAGALPVAAADLAPSAIVANPSSYEGKAITVAGKVAHFQTSKTPMGTVAAFQLCDAKCVVVIDETNTARHDGDQATVSGKFQMKFKGRVRSFDNVVLVK
ncbi:MAG: hypothetical protein M3R44_04920 [Candidatus Eremiobacteraeota bacterium]|nr:hypothetical protein [Candidatus Eremiobacteraeota bacterium]